jgi:hypothetical protein
VMHKHNYFTFHDEWSVAWLGRERRDRPGRPLAARGAIGRRRRGRLDAEDAMGLRRTGRRRHGGRPESVARQLQLPVLHSRRGDDSGALSGDGGVATQTQNSGDRRWWQAMTAADKHAGRDGQTRRKLRYLEDSFEGPLLCGLGSKFCEPT